MARGTVIEAEPAIAEASPLQRKLTQAIANDAFVTPAEPMTQLGPGDPDSRTGPMRSAVEVRSRSR